MPEMPWFSFSLLSALSTQNVPPQAASKPFSKNRDGFVMAEGAGTLVLESYDAAVARGASRPRRCAELSRFFPPYPLRARWQAGDRLRAEDAGQCGRSMDHINAHSTPENDKMEYLATNAVFGDHASNVRIEHGRYTISAAGAVEAIFSLLTLEHQRIPPTLNYENADPAIPFNVGGESNARVTTVAVELVWFSRRQI